MQEIAPDPLFLACTRPAMKWGVPIIAFVMNMMASTLVLVFVKNPLYAAAFGVPLHYVFRILAGWDPNFFRILHLWMETKGRNLGSDLWGGSSVSPLPSRRSKRLGARYHYV